MGSEEFEMRAVVSFCAVAFLAIVTSIHAFNGHVVTEGPAKVTIGEIGTATEFDKPLTVDVTVENSGEEAIKVRLEMAGLVDEWYAVGVTEKEIALGAKEEKTVAFRIACRRGGLSALYPVHIYAAFSYRGELHKMHCVGVFGSDFREAVVTSAVSGKMPVNIVPARGVLSLASLRTHRVLWQFFGQAEVRMPIGWRGTDGESGASFSSDMITRRTSKDSIVMHPAWRERSGTIVADYLIKLPKTKKIEFHFANAIRDHSQEEPASDGVTFRVSVGKEKVFERHTDSKKWVDGKVDLSKFAGRTIVLRLESHPGPKNNTTCDSSYWGEPVIVAGEFPKPVSESLRKRRMEWAAKGMNLPNHADPRRVLFGVGEACTASIVLGDNGLLDSAIAFGETYKPDSCVVFDGLNVSIMGGKVGSPPSSVVVRDVEIIRTGDSTVKIVHHLSGGDEEFDLNAVIFSDRGGVRIKLDCAKRITDISLGAADQKARRIYYGHGYCIEEPKAFRAGFGGHNLSTSHVGFDFENGVSLLTATDNPPDYLEVTPEKHIYALHTHLNATLTFVPGVNGAFDCAVKYQDLFDKKPSPGFKRKAGRFVFDIWGGRYADIAETMRKMVDYGLTDSLLTVHVWQRWGYDYRLPDIYPPNPAYGTVEDMKKIGAVCDEHDIPWGLHDNYIDFYPDAAEYSYEHICFTESGEPIKAWINTGRDAQSYRWRPDRVMPFVKRNMKLIKADLSPTHYFIDVFTSIPCFDYYDKEGNFHSMLETRKCWGMSFRWIQDYLGGAITTSEAGHDQLIGYLDGSDCQHLTLSAQPGSFVISVPCKDSQRVPWFDAVLHDKFSLHGVGYPSRYKLTEFDDHADPLETDDYISAEILEGHAMMIDRAGFGRAAVRKYWLGQDFIRSIALDRIKRVEFAEDDIHRQIVTWRGGAKVYVNRGKTDWAVAGKTLPPYGYFAVNGEIESSIERIDGQIVEQSRTGSTRYCNARGFALDDRLNMQSRINQLEYLGDRRFTLLIDWDVVKPTAKNLAVFLHFADSTKSGREDIAFQGDLRPATPTSQWKNTVTIGNDRVIHIPEECGVGRYDILVGLWDPATGRRYRLIGDDTGGLRYKLGTVTIQADDGRITGVSCQKAPAAKRPVSRRNINRVGVDFGHAVTSGAFRCQSKADSVMITPLPDIEHFAITLRIAALTRRAATKVKTIWAVDTSGNRTRNVSFSSKSDTVEFETLKGEFGYEIRLAAK